MFRLKIKMGVRAKLIAMVVSVFFVIYACVSSIQVTTTNSLLSGQSALFIQAIEEENSSQVKTNANELSGLVSQFKIEGNYPPPS
jgi:hypothetical protein